MRLISTTVCIIAATSTCGYAGEPSPILVEVSGLTEVDTITSGMGTSLDRSSGEFVSKNAEHNTVSAWGNTVVHAVNTSNALGDGTGYELSFGIEKNFFDIVALGISVSKQEYDFDNKNVKADAYAPYLSVKLGNHIYMDASFGKSNVEDRPNLNIFDREFKFVKVSTELSLGDNFLLKPYLSYTEIEQDRTDISLFEIDRTQVGVDFAYKLENWELNGGLAWENKKFQVVFPNVPAIGENYETNSPKLSIGASKDLDNIQFNIQASYQEFQQDVDVVSIDLDLSIPF